MATVSPIGVNARGRQLFCYVAEDITSRREAEDAIRESQLRFRSMADSVPALIWLSDLNRKPHLLQQDLARIHGHRSNGNWETAGSITSIRMIGIPT